MGRDEGMPDLRPTRGPHLSTSPAPGSWAVLAAFRARHSLTWSLLSAERNPRLGARAPWLYSLLCASLGFSFPRAWRERTGTNIL